MKEKIEKKELEGKNMSGSEVWEQVCQAVDSYEGEEEGFVVLRVDEEGFYLGYNASMKHLATNLATLIDGGLFEKKAEYTPIAKSIFRAVCAVDVKTDGALFQAMGVYREIIGGNIEGKG